MMVQKIVNQTQPKMQEVLDHLTDDLKTIRTGSASTALVDNLIVPYYGTPTPLKQMASLTTPTPKEIVIQPWDKNLLGDIELAVRNSNLGLAPINDGRVIRLVLPSLTQERREQLKKLVHQKAEAVRINLRNTRNKAWEEIQQLEKQKQLSEDDRYRGEEELNKLIDQFNQKVEEISLNKEKELMTI